MHIDIANKKAEIITDGGILDREGYQFLDKAKIIINDWKMLGIKIFDHKTKNFIPIDPIIISDEYLLTDIVDFIYTPSELKLHGFGKPEERYWLEWEFTQPKIEIYGEVLLDHP